MHLSTIHTRPAVLCGLVAVALACNSGPADDTGERMSREHAGDRPEPAAAAEEATDHGADAVELVSQRVVYATVDGRQVTGYLARPADPPPGRLPGLIVIHEWWGLNENIETMARMLARPGYVALAVDLYGGRTADSPEAARALVDDVAAHPETALANLRQAYDYLAGPMAAPRIGSIGWCFGGGWSLQTAVALPADLDAVVLYYGRLEADRNRLAPLAMPLLGIFGAEDQGIPVAEVRQFEATLKELGKDATIVVYDGAGHAFANPSGTRYHPEAARDAWQKTLAFLARTLKG